MGPLLHVRYPELRDRLAHVALGSGPTPVRPLAGLTTGPAPVWLKDDGAFGDGPWGGNKVRKLEWLLADALRRRRRTILTLGGLGTNWGLAAALYAREHGLSTALLLVDQPVDDHVSAQLDRLRASGARLHFTRNRGRTLAMLPLAIARHSGDGRPPYVLPPGGSSPVGTLGYVEAALEIAGQVRAGTLPEPSHVACAVGSGGTAAGLLLGLELAGLPTRVVAVVVNDRLRLDVSSLTRLARRSWRQLRRRGAEAPEPALRPDRLLLVRDWLGAGYGHATPEGGAAQALAAEREALVLEPVYTAKAMAAVLGMNGEGRFGDGPVLYLHTNGPR